MKKCFHPTFKFELLQRTHLGVRELFGSCRTQFLSLGDDHSHPAGQSEKQNRLRLLQLSLGRACDDFLAQIK